MDNNIAIVEDGKIKDWVSIKYEPILTKIIKYGTSYPDYLTDKEIKIIQEPNCVEYMDVIAQKVQKNKDWLKN